MKEKVLLSIAALVAACPLLASCSRRSAQGHDVRIGVISMLSGEHVRPTSSDMGRGVRLAVQSANARGGLRVGRARLTVTVLEEDDGNSPEGAVEAARKLIYQDRVIALIGPQFSSNAIPVARLAEQQRIVMVCPMSTHPDTTAGKRFVFRIPYVDTFQGAVLARFAREVLHARSAAVLYDVAAAYNKTLADVFERTLASLAGAILASETYTTDSNVDFTPQLTRVSAVDPDLLFLPNYANDAALQVAQAHSLGIQATLLGGDGWDGRAFSADPQFGGAFYSIPWHPGTQTEVSRAFVAAFTEAYGTEPTDLAATAYDAANLLFAAVERAARADSEAIRDTLYTMEPFAGVTGTISYRGSGDPVKSATVVQIGPGQTAVYAVVEP